MSKLSTQVLNVLERSEIKDNSVILPENLDRKIYQDVNKVLENIEGKWNKKTKAHIFPKNPTEYIENVILTGEMTDYKKQFQFFPTPEKIVDQLIELADIQKTDKVLEPSAGNGVILKKVSSVTGSLPFFCEINDEMRHKYLDDYLYLQRDFLDLEKETVLNCGINKIVANPPFSNQQDVDHVLYMYELLPPGGLLVSVMSNSWTFRENRKSTEFRLFLDQNNAEIIDLDAGAFKESGTMVATCIVKIRKKECSQNGYIEPLTIKNTPSEPVTKNITKPELIKTEIFEKGEKVKITDWKFIRDYGVDEAVINKIEDNGYIFLVNNRLIYLSPDKIQKKVLTSEQIERFKICHSGIEKGKNAFLEVGNLLLEVRDNDLYLADGFKTFTAYSEKIGFSYQHAWNLIESFKNDRILSTVVDVEILKPGNEKSARNFQGLSDSERIELARKAKEISDQTGRKDGKVFEQAREIVSPKPKSIKTMQNGAAYQPFQKPALPGVEFAEEKAVEYIAPVGEIINKPDPDLSKTINPKKDLSEYSKSELIENIKVFSNWDALHESQLLQICYAIKTTEPDEPNPDRIVLNPSYIQTTITGKDEALPLDKRGG